MKPVTLGLVLLAAVTGFSLLGRTSADTTAVPAPILVVPHAAPPAPGDPEWTVQPIPTDGWDGDEPPG